MTDSEPTKPLLLLDVDGVLCPFGFQWARTETGMVLADTNSEDVPEGYEYVDGHHIYISKENTRRIRELMEDFDIVWCTGWCDAANEVISPLHDLPEFPTVNIFNCTIDDPIHWKGGAIREYVGDRPHAFVDDDIHEHGLAWAEHRNQTSPTLWLKTDHRIGLTDDDVARLRAWAKEIHD